MVACPFCFVLVFWVWGVCCFVVFLFPVLQVFGIPNSPRSLDLDDRQALPNFAAAPMRAS